MNSGNLPIVRNAEFAMMNSSGTGSSGTSNNNNKFSHQDCEGRQELTLGRKYEKTSTGCRGFFYDAWQNAQILKKIRDILLFALR